MPQPKKILLGITGSIAAYKTPELVRQLRKNGSEVKVILTPAALGFVTPLSLATVSGNPVLSAYFDPSSGVWANHVELGLWADCMVIAPASANSLAKMAEGIADNLLLATYLSARCPIHVFPAMDADMYVHPAVQGNLNRLASMGVIVHPPESGELASGLTGKGRMPQPEAIADVILKSVEWTVTLKGKKILISAGPTHEPVDAVRYISNYSTGQMGVALARAARNCGAHVTLVCGPIAIPLPAGIDVVNIKTAREMHQAVMPRFSDCDIAIMAAAVADFTPEQTHHLKIKKDRMEELNLKLIATPDILKEAGSRKKKGQRIMGFALEIQEGEANAKKKLTDKNADFIVLNMANEQGSGFGSFTNRVHVFASDNKMYSFELMPKELLAYKLLELLAHA